MHDDTAAKKHKREAWCYQEKHALRRIRDAFDDKPEQASSSIALYVALTELASDHQSDTFDASQADIAKRAGLSVATVKRLLPLLKQLCLVTIKLNTHHGVKVQSTYTLNRKKWR